MNWQFGKIGVLVYFIVLKLKFCKLAQLLCVSGFSGEREFERIETKIKTYIPDLCPKDDL